MKVVIDIPEEFEEHFKKDRFEDSLARVSSDIESFGFQLAGRYEKETITMLRIALKNSIPYSNNNAITVNTTKLAKFIKEHLQGDCECRTLCYDYCGEYDCTESIEECIINNLNNIQ